MTPRATALRKLVDAAPKGHKPAHAGPRCNVFARAETTHTFTPQVRKRTS